MHPIMGVLVTGCGLDSCISSTTVYSGFDSVGVLVNVCGLDFVFQVQFVFEI